MLPNLKDKDYVVLADLITKYPREFYTDMTDFLIEEMYHYIDTAMVWRVSIMGPTRIGKSEIGSSLNFLYQQRFNKNVENGHYLANSSLKTMFENESLKLETIKYTTEFIYGSPSEYQTKQKQRAKDKSIKFGQIHHIDEDSKTSGGIGTMSQSIEMMNINNITAKFMQSEVWVTPNYMITKNAPYGIRAYHKDLERKINFGLLYKIEMTESGSADFKFLGWVAIPLHPYEDFRIAYNTIKDGWIKSELEGKADARSNSRFEVSKKLAKSKFWELSDTGKSFIYPKSERMAYLEQLILTGEVPNFNEIEKCRIVDQATLLKKTEGDNDA